MRRILKAVWIVVIMVGFNNTTKAQTYLSGYFGYFTEELSYGDTVGHMHADTVCFAAEVTMDGLHLIDKIQLTVSDSLETVEYTYTGHVQPITSPVGFADVHGSKQVYFGRPHVLKVQLPRTVMPTIKNVRIRIKLIGGGGWINLINQHI